MKRFLYLFQVPGELPAELEQAGGPDSDILFLSWRSRSSDPRSVFYPWSSWTQGRNRLLKDAIGTGYQYFIFGDGDVQLKLAGSRAGALRGRSPWRTFEEFLLGHEPAVGCPRYDWHLAGALDERIECQTLRFFDAVLNAFHREALSTLLPYYDLLDEQSTHYSPNLVCSLAADLYPGHVLQTNSVRVVNKESLRGYHEMLFHKPDQLYLESLRDPNDAARFQRYRQGARHPTWGEPLCKSGSYQISEDELSRRYRLDHTLWARKRELLELPRDSDFYSDDPASERARRWRSTREGLPANPPPHRWLTLWRRTRALRSRLGLVRSAWGYRAVHRTLARLRAARLRTASAHRRRALRAPWREWAATPDLRFDVPVERQAETIELLAAALDQLQSDQIVFVDVGGGRGDVLELLSGNAWLTKAVFSIGIDTVDARAHSTYNGFVLCAVSNGPEGVADFHRHKEIGGGKSFATTCSGEVLETLRVPTYRLSTILRQFGLADEVVHFIRIDASGCDLDVFLSLGDLARNCLFLRIATVHAKAGDRGPALDEGQTTFTHDRVAIEAAGFRLLNLAQSSLTPEADATFVNVKLFGVLLPHLVGRAQRSGRTNAVGGSRAGIPRAAEAAPERAERTEP